MSLIILRSPHFLSAFDQIHNGRKKCIVIALTHCCLRSRLWFKGLGLNLKLPNQILTFLHHLTFSILHKLRNQALELTVKDGYSPRFLTSIRSKFFFNERRFLVKKKTKKQTNKISRMIFDKHICGIICWRKIKQTLF